MAKSNRSYKCKTCKFTTMSKVLIVRHVLRAHTDKVQEAKGDREKAKVIIREAIEVEDKWSYTDRDQKPRRPQKSMATVRCKNSKDDGKSMKSQSNDQVNKNNQSLYYKCQICKSTTKSKVLIVRHVLRAHAEKAHRPQSS